MGLNFRNDTHPISNKVSPLVGRARTPSPVKVWQTQYYSLSYVLIKTQKYLLRAARISSNFAVQTFNGHGQTTHRISDRCGH